MLTRIEHPCVENGRVSLDLLTVPTDRIKKAPVCSQRYKMWSPTYTVLSVLVQLQGACA